MADINDMILAELQAVRGEISDGFKDSVQRITAVETKIQPLFGNGQPGIIERIQDDIQEFKLQRAKQFGWYAGIMASLQVAWELFAHKILHGPHISR